MVEETPLVSIVVPVYNGDAYLSEAIDSILSQEYPNIELIAVDDGSTDDTPRILSSYGEQIRVVRQENAGQSAALNKGWSSSLGSILGYLSADDVLHPQAVKRSVEVLQSQPETDATYCSYALISPSSDVISDVRMKLDYPVMVKRLQIPIGPGAFFRRSIYEKVGGWKSEFRQSPDVDFWLNVASKGKIQHIDDVLASFRVHPASTSFRKVDPHRADEPIRIIERYLQGNCPEEADALRKAARGTSRMIAARAHFRAGRYYIGLKRLAEAVAISPSRLLDPYCLRLLASGLFGRIRHNVLWYLAQRPRRR